MPACGQIPIPLSTGPRPYVAKTCGATIHAGSLQGAEQVGNLGGGEAEYFAEDEHGSLPGGEVLPGGHEGEFDAFPREVARLR